MLSRRSNVFGKQSTMKLSKDPFSIFPPKSRNLEDKQKFAGFGWEPYGGKIKLAEYLNKFDQLLMSCWGGQEDNSFSSELRGNWFKSRNNS